MSRAGKGAGEHAGEREPRAPGGCGDRGNRSRQETPGWRALDLHLPAARGRFQPPLPSDGRGGGKGRLKRVAFPREKQRLRSAHSAAGDALLPGWGPWRARGSRGGWGGLRWTRVRDAEREGRRGALGRPAGASSLRPLARCPGKQRGAPPLPTPGPHSTGWSENDKCPVAGRRRPLDRRTRSGPKGRGWTDGRERGQAE